MNQRLSALLDPNDRVKGADGADDTTDEAPAGRFELYRRSELRRALSFPSSFSKCRYLMASRILFFYFKSLIILI